MIVAPRQGGKKTEVSTLTTLQFDPSQASNQICAPDWPPQPLSPSAPAGHHHSAPLGVACLDVAAAQLGWLCSRLDTAVQGFYWNIITDRWVLQS